MSTTLTGRRTTPPDPPTSELVLKPPPRLRADDDASSGALLNAIPMLGGVASIVVLTATQSGSSRGFVAAGLVLATTLGFVAVQIERQRGQRIRRVNRARGDYLAYLAGVRHTLHDAATHQRQTLDCRFPEPSAGPALAAEGSGVWELEPEDEGFLQIRFGLGSQPLGVTLVSPETDLGDVDPVSASAVRRLLNAHATQPLLPATLELRDLGHVEVCGTEDHARALIRALVCSAVLSHPPSQLGVAVLTSEPHLPHWDWVKWLPHAASGRATDAAGRRRLVTTSLTELAAIAPEQHLLLVVDGIDLTAGDRIDPLAGRRALTLVGVVSTQRPLEDPGRLRLHFEEGAGKGSGGDGSGGDADKPAITVRRWGQEPMPALADQCDLATAEALARRLAALPSAHLRPAQSGQDVATPDFLGLLGLGELGASDRTHPWLPRAPRDRLRVPIGLGDHGEPIHLDLKESAQAGMGPHGLVIGATGSGKSELLRTLVLGLALTHSPAQLNLVLVDFKGGATFAGMAELPHVSALITNLAQELALVDRMQDALTGELVRRQELLRAGGFASLHDYERARESGAELPALPSLLIVVDEFSELLSAEPEFVDLFVAIGRLGRSLGLHLLLASQRLEEGRLRGLESHLSYRIGLRTFSASESRAVLGVPDAHQLPATPGFGYLKADPTPLMRFRTAYVSGPARERRHERPGGPVRMVPFTAAEVRGGPMEYAAPDAVSPTAPEPGPSLLEAGVAALAGQGPGAHQVWLPPLDQPETLDRLLGDLASTADHGLTSADHRRLGELVVPVGVVDRPRDQRRDTLTVDLGGAAGHVAVVGGPRSGKSTLLRTLVTSLALTTTPRAAQFYVLDFGGGTFAPLVRLPHVAGIGTRSEPDVVRRILAEVRGILDHREGHFRAHGIDSIEAYRSRRASRGAVIDDGYGDVFLVVDGWATLRAEFEELEAELQQLAARSLGFGVHVLAAATRWADFRSAMRDVFGTRLELRLGDPLDSEVDRKTAALVPTGRPGRGILPGGLHFLAALPRIDGDARSQTLADGLDDLITRVAAAWSGPPGPRLRLLPERIALDDVRRLPPTCRPRHLLLGINERDLAPVALEPDTDPHLLVFGDSGSGKSAVLRTYLHEVMRTRTPERAQIVVVDYRRSLLGEVPDPYLLNYLTSSTQAQPALRDLAEHLEQRLPGPDVTPRHMRDRSWWTGAEVFVVVDDYDLVATHANSPLQSLVPLLPQARDVGLNLIVARRSGGAARALYEPVLQSLRDLAAPALLLSGNPDDGPLIGATRPEAATPGRGRLITRERGIEVVQVAWQEQR